MNDLLHPRAYAPQLLVRALRDSADRPVLHLDGRDITGAELSTQISQVTQALAALGLGIGSPVGLLSKNRPEVLVMSSSAIILGCRTTPLNPMGSFADQSYILNDAAITTLVYDPTHFEDRAKELSDSVPGGLQLIAMGPSAHGVDILAQAAQHVAGTLVAAAVNGDAVSAIVYTGGTTGRPKGVMSTYRSGRELVSIQLAEWELPEAPRFLICTPLSHAGAAFLLPVLLRGGTLVVLPAFEPGAVLEAIERHRISALMLVPTMIYLLLDHPSLATRDLSSLEVLYYGASAIDPERLADGIAKLGPVFFQFYGQTECGMTISTLRRSEHTDGRLATCGRPVPWLDVRLLDENLQEVPAGEPGEICVRGPLVMKGYWNRPEESAEALAGDWLHTGDVARADDRGYLTIVDRLKDMIVTGGFNVFPREIEGVLTGHSQVAAAAVIGVPHPKWGEAVKAYVVARGDEPDVGELRTLVREEKGAVQVPKEFEFVEALPLTSLGKIDKKALRKAASQ